MILAETYMELLASPAHWLFELTKDAALFPLGVLYQRWHDKHHHDPAEQLRNRVVLAGNNRSEPRYKGRIDPLGVVFWCVFIATACVCIVAGITTLIEEL